MRGGPLMRGGPPIGHHARVIFQPRTTPGAAPPIPGDALVLLVGPAGSGKSTWAAEHFSVTQVVSSDACRAMVCDDPTDQAATPDAFRVLHAITSARVRRGLLTVVDATNLLPSARRPLLRLAARWERPCVAVVFRVPLDELLRRNAGRPHPVPDDVVRRHAALLPAALASLPEEGYLAIVDA